MTAFYWDASDMAQRYLLEPGSQVVRSLFTNKRREDIFATCSLLQLEMESIASRALNARRLSRNAYARMLRSFADDYASLSLVPLSADLAADAIEFVRLYQLKALDALHLTAAVRIQQALPDRLVLVTSDHDLVAAGARTGLTVVDGAEAAASRGPL